MLPFFTAQLARGTGQEKLGFGRVSETRGYTQGVTPGKLKAWQNPPAKCSAKPVRSYPRQDARQNTPAKCSANHPQNTTGKMLGKTPRQNARQITSPNTPGKMLGNYPRQNARQIAPQIPLARCSATTPSKMLGKKPP